MLNSTTYEMYHGAWFGKGVEKERHQRDRQEHADLDHHAQHERALAEDLAPHFLVVDRIGAVFEQVGAFGGANNRSGN